MRFSPEEKTLGEQALKEMGVPEAVPFVCFIGRDSAYLDNFLLEIHWNYHNYRDMDIQNFVPAAEELVRRGYFTIRMEHVVQKALMVDNPKIIDYATKYRTELMDLYLCSKCQCKWHVWIGFSSNDTV